MLVVAADPVLELLAAAVPGHLDGEVNAHETDAATHEIAKDGQPAVLNEGMAGTAVGVEKDAAGSLECLLAVRPAVAIMCHLQFRNTRQVLFQQQNPGV